VNQRRREQDGRNEINTQRSALGVLGRTLKNQEGALKTLNNTLVNTQNRLKEIDTLLQGSVMVSDDPRDFVHVSAPGLQPTLSRETSDDLMAEQTRLQKLVTSTKKQIIKKQEEVNATKAQMTVAQHKL
jgi:hypothetical protein